MLLALVRWRGLDRRAWKPAHLFRLMFGGGARSHLREAENSNLAKERRDIHERDSVHTHT